MIFVQPPITNKEVARRRAKNTVGTFRLAAGGRPESSRPDGRLARRPRNRPITAALVGRAGAMAAGRHSFDEQFLCSGSPGGRRAGGRAGG